MSLDAAFAMGGLPAPLNGNTPPKRVPDQTDNPNATDATDVAKDAPKRGCLSQRFDHGELASTEWSFLAVSSLHLLGCSECIIVEVHAFGLVADVCRLGGTTADLGTSGAKWMVEGANASTSVVNQRNGSNAAAATTVACLRQVIFFFSRLHRQLSHVDGILAPPTTGIEDAMVVRCCDPIQSF
jgi:hypothetical protein